MKKILFITRSSEKGGEAVFIKSISNHLKNRFHIKIISMLDKPNNVHNGNKVFLDPPFILKKPLINLKSLNKIKKEIKISDMSVHFIFDFYSIIFCLMCFYYNKRIITTFHTNLDGKKKSRMFVDPVLRFISINLFILLSKKVIFITNSQKDNFYKVCLFKKKFLQKSIVIYNFIDKSKIIRRKSKFPNKILFVGRYTEQKGFHLILKLTKELKNINFVVIGDDKPVKKLKNLDNLGRIDNKSIYPQYDKCSIFILPSRSETFGMVILEAMARGLVVLASDLPAIREYFIDNRNGYLFPPGDIEKIRELIIYLRNNPKEVKRISKNNINDIWKFTAEKQVPKYIKVYEEVLK